MITIGYSTRSSNPQFVDYLKKSCGLPNVAVIEKINNGEKSLSVVYNEILSESNTEIVVLCHDDIYFDTNRWGVKLQKHFANSNFGILGVAGTTSIPESGMWWEDPSTMIGIVNHEHNGKKWESKYSENFENEIRRTVLVDGLFIAINKPKLKFNFDEEVTGFHFYDVNFCFQNYLENVLVGVITNIRLTHKSIGQTNPQWEVNRQLFSERYKKVLPQKVKIDTNTKLKVLFAVNNIAEFEEQIFNFSNNKCDLTLLTSKLTKDQEKKFKKTKLKLTNEVPGHKLGDGKWLFKNNGQQEISILNKYYKIDNINFDLIVVDNKSAFDKLKVTFSKTPKFYYNTGSKKYKSHDSVIFESASYQNENIYELAIDQLNAFEYKNSTVKIITGYSEKGGSTVAFINLTNYLNEHGVDCTFYGPHNWHLDKCKSDLLSNFRFEKSDRIISHFLKLGGRPDVKKIVLSSHEKWWFEVKDLPVYWDEVIFLHDQHRNYHSGYKGDYKIIPNLKESLTKYPNKNDVKNVAGIIGAIESRKQTDVSIERALKDGCEKILLYGAIQDPNYYKDKVEKYIDNEKVFLVGFSENKQNMYNSIGKVYHSSIGEVACLVKDECYLTGTEFFGNEETSHEVSTLTNEEILNLWKKILEI